MEIRHRKTGQLLYHAREETLAGADLRLIGLHGAALDGADLAGADHFGSRLQGADLSGADLRGADLRGANLCGARLDFARYDHTTRWPRGMNPRKRGARLET